MAAAIPTPLTTTFTPSPSCLTDIHWATDSSWYVLGQYDTACIPHGTATNAVLPNPTLSSFYSPALYCPSGFTIACSSEISVSTDIETRAYCCPDLGGVQLFSKTQFSCATSPPTWGAWSSYGCSLGWGNLVTESPFTVVVTDEQGTRTTTTSETQINGGLNGYSVQIRWKASDLEAAATGTDTSANGAPSDASTDAVTGPGHQSTVQISGPSTSISTSGGQSDSQNQDSAGLSTGAKVAIGIIIPLVVILAIVAGIFILRRKRQTSHRETLRTGSNDKILPPVQAMSHPRFEMEGSYHSGYSEMDEKPLHLRQELPGSEPMRR